MRLVKAVIGGVGLLILVVVVVGLMLPRDNTVTRTITIDAPASVIYGIVNGFERFPEWSPWQEIDPDQHIELEGPRSGVGAAMVWASADPAVGVGYQQVIETDPDRRVRVAVQFDDFPDAVSQILLEPRADGATEVTWSLHTDFGYRPVLRWVGLFFDAMVGPDHERGLARLKRLAEDEAAKGTGPS